MGGGGCSSSKNVQAAPDAAVLCSHMQAARLKGREKRPPPMASALPAPQKEPGPSFLQSSHCKGHETRLAPPGLQKQQPSLQVRSASYWVGRPGWEQLQVPPRGRSSDQDLPGLLCPPGQRTSGKRPQAGAQWQGLWLSPLRQLSLSPLLWGHRPGLGQEQVPMRVWRTEPAMSGTVARSIFNCRERRRQLSQSLS